MRQYLIAILLAGWAYAVHGQVPSCGGTGFSRWGGSCYKIGNSKMSFTNSATYCENQAFSHLVIFDSSAENEYIKGQAKSLTSQAGNYWIGLTNHREDGAWRWWGWGKPTAVTDWYTNEPNNDGGNELCVHLRYDGGYDYQWNDAECTGLSYPICELEG